MAEGRLCPMFWEVLVLFMKVAHQGVARFRTRGGLWVHALSSGFFFCVCSPWDPHSLVYVRYRADPLCFTRVLRVFMILEEGFREPSVWSSFSSTWVQSYTRTIKVK